MPYIKQMTTHDEMVDLVRRTTAAQGLPERVEDRVQARNLAVMLSSARRAAQERPTEGQRASSPAGGHLPFRLPA